VLEQIEFHAYLLQCYLWDSFPLWLGICFYEFSSIVSNLNMRGLCCYFQNVHSHTIHVVIYLPAWMVDKNGTCLHKYTSPMDPIGLDVRKSGLCRHDGVVVGGQSVFWLPPRAPSVAISAPVRSVDPMGDPGSSMDRKTPEIIWTLNILSANMFNILSDVLYLVFLCNVGFSSGESLLLWTTRYFFGGCDLLHHDFVVVIL